MQKNKIKALLIEMKRNSPPPRIRGSDGREDWVSDLSDISDGINNQFNDLKE